jgi:hypothetical protein
VANQHGMMGETVSSRTRLLRFALVVSVCAFYVLAEWGLRDAVYGRPKIGSSTEWKPIVDKLPLLLRDPIERRLKAADLEDKIIHEKDRNKRLKAHYELAALYSGSQRREVYQRIVRGWSRDPQAAMALAALIREFNPDNPTQMYLRYAKGVETQTPAQRAMVWATGWSVTQGRPRPETEEFLRAMFEAQAEGAALVEAYEELMSSAMIAGDLQLVARLTPVLERCRALWEQEQARLLP